MRACSIESIDDVTKDIMSLGKVRAEEAEKILAEYKRQAFPAGEKKKKVAPFASQRRYYGCCYWRNVHEAVIDGDSRSIIEQMSNAQRRDSAAIRKAGGVERAERYDESKGKKFVGLATRRANARDEAGRTPLSVAIKEERPDIADLLLNMQANPNKADDQMTLATPLLSAVLADMSSSVLQLAKFDAKVDAADANGLTPLMLASLLGNSEMCQILLDFRACVDLVDKMGWTSLTYAARGGNVACLEMLFEAGADPKHKDKQGYTAKDWARYVRLTTTTSIGEVNKHGICEAFLERAEVESQRLI